MFYYGTSKQNIINRMKKAQKDLVKKIWLKKITNLPLKNVKELIILASIVEKESANIDEMSHIAQVFINRLNKGMRLQSDSTTIYGYFGSKSWISNHSKITKNQLKSKNKYNTYYIKGLPPGPISNPGQAALEATASPNMSNDLFFVSNGYGKHVFAKTYKQHYNNVLKWRLSQIHSK